MLMGAYIFPLMIDDAYITYSYARNLARFGQLVYHPTNPQLSTSAPLYAVLLGIGSKLGFHIPALSNALGAVSIFGASVYLMLLCYRHKKRWAGATVGLLLATSPVLWLTLGLETCFYVCLLLAAFYYYDRGQYVVTAVLTATAILTRGDGVLVAGLLSFYHLIVRYERNHANHINQSSTGRNTKFLQRRIPRNALVAFFIVLAPAVLYLTLSFGSPIPTTLQTKQGQAAIGFTGFYAGTSFFQGLLILLRGWLDQSLLYSLWLPVSMLGIFCIRHFWWSWGVVAWAVSHFTAYSLLGAAPYTWYYAPLVPGAVLLVGLGLQYLTGWAQRVWLQVLLGGALLSCLVLAQVTSLQAIVSEFTAELPPTSEQAKVLPRSHTNDMYRAIGEWLHAHTPQNATIAVNDVGIIGYYADRAMIDFLGILQLDVAQALERRDLFYAIPHFLPDYIVLGEDLVIYNIWLRGDPWFSAHYKPIKVFTDEQFVRFGGSPLVVFKRVYNPTPVIEQATNIAFTPDLILDSFGIDKKRLKPGDSIRVQLNWFRRPQMNQALHITAHLINKDGEVVTERSADFDTSLWAENEVSPIYTPILLPDDLVPGSYRLRVRIVMADQTDAIHELTTVSVESGAGGKRKNQRLVTSGW